MQEDNILTYYRGFDSKYPNLGNNKPFIWLTDSKEYAIEYSKGSNSLAEIRVNAATLNVADEYDIEQLEYKFDYDLYEPNENLSNHLILDGYNAYLIYSTQQDEMICLLDKSMIIEVNIIDK